MRLLFTETGLLIGIVNIFLPFMVLPLFASIRQLDPRLSDAAATLGGGPVYCFLRVILPLTVPGIVAGGTLVFSLSIAAYVIPTLLMGDAYQTLPTTIATAFLYLQDPQRGSVAGVVLLALSLLVVAASASLRAPVERIMTRLVARAFAGAMLAASVVFLLMPLVVTVLVSLSPSPVFALPTDTLSLTWYRHVKTLDGLTESVVLTLEVAVVATAVSLLIGTLAAIAVVRGQFPGREAIATFLISPLMLPGLVIGIAVLQYFRTLGLREALPSLLLAHVVIVLPFVMRTLTAGLAAFDFALIDAARTLGLSYPRAVLRVMVPVLAPSFITGALFGFLASVDNYPVSIFLTDVYHRTLPIQLLQYLGESPTPP